MIASFDVATAVGFAYGGERDGIPKCGHWDLPPGERDLTRALSSLYDSVKALCEANRVKICAIEEPLLYVKTDAMVSFRMYSLAAVARAGAYRAGAQVVLRNVRSVRAHCLGKGGGALKGAVAKPAIFKWCQRMGWPVQTYDESDAAAQWAYEMAMVYPKWAPRTTPLFSGSAREGL